jgi:itaconate CoA-transferase
MALPLEGITVVSLEQAVAAPFATRQLADMGAWVIKVERPEKGDFARSYDEIVRELPSHFVWINRSKLSATSPATAPLALTRTKRPMTCSSSARPASSPSRARPRRLPKRASPSPT